MDSTTSDPPPELSLLEQFGAWLDAFPAVPPWVQWLLAALTFSTAVGGPIIFLLWRSWGANWWAARSRDSALRRATNLAQDVLGVHALSRNRPEMFNDLAVFLAGYIVIGMGVIVGAIIMTNLHAAGMEGLPPSDNLVTARFFLALIVWAGSYCGLAFLSGWYSISMAPLKDIDRYTLRSRNRIERMFAKAGVPQEAASVALKEFDDLVDEVRKQEIR